MDPLSSQIEHYINILNFAKKFRKDVRLKSKDILFYSILSFSNPVID